jgi:membrane-associated phospholipid phosphatase
MDISDLLSISVGGLYLLTTGLYYITGNIIHIKALFGLAGTTIISETIKQVFIKNTSVRPRGASNCNLLCNDGNQAGRPGMPSSHSAGAAFFAGYYFQFTQNPIIKLSLITYAILVMYSRYVKKCHTLSQVIVGAILGLSLSFVAVRHL